MLFETKDEALTFVGSIVQKGSSIFGRCTYYLLWSIAQLFTFILRKRTKVHGMRYINVQGPVIFVSNHMNNWDHLRIVLSTYRHVRPLYKVQAYRHVRPLYKVQAYRRVRSLYKVLDFRHVRLLYKVQAFRRVRPLYKVLAFRHVRLIYKVQAFKNFSIRQIFIFGGAVPVAQPQKAGESLTRDEIKSAMYTTRASQDCFVQLIRDGWAGLVFPQGTRRPEGEAIGKLNIGLWPLFQYPDTDTDPDPLIVAIGITSASMVARKGVRLSQMPAERDPFLEDLSELMQRALDDAIAVSK